MNIKKILLTVKNGILKIIEFCKNIYKNRDAIIERCKQVIVYWQDIFEYCKKTITGDDLKAKNRVLILLFSVLFIFNYLAFCLHTSKNIFDIFPSIPLLEQKQQITIYIPDTTAQTIIQEQRQIPIFNSQEKLLNHLFTLVVKGSVYNDNTSMIVPSSLFVRKIWLYGQQEKTCVIDVEPEILDQKSTVVKGSEAIFKKALEQTIHKNIPSIKDIIILEKGIPNKALWEM